ncbi:MAG: hypothetical protein K1X72_04475 [Pyrinomonadaceae bacterium]|nr:hypothetical protein [Pyrinomonadaceae bacterium]
MKKKVNLYNVFYDGKFIRQISAYNQNQAILFVRDLVIEKPIKKKNFRAELVDHGEIKEE